MAIMPFLEVQKTNPIKANIRGDRAFYQRYKRLPRPSGPRNDSGIWAALCLSAPFDFAQGMLCGYDPVLKNKANPSQGPPDRSPPKGVERTRLA
jgi:hypothetical protein